MSTWLLLAVKVLLAGTLVALLSHLSSAFKPKIFAGLFAGAPTVASVSLLLTGLQKPQAAHLGALGMTVGAVGLVVSCVVAALLVPKAHATLASVAAWGAWALVTVGLLRLVPL